jgi:hypothetical protein
MDFYGDIFKICTKLIMMKYQIYLIQRYYTNMQVLS